MLKLQLDKLKFKKFVFKKSKVVIEIGNEWLKIAENSFSAKGECITKVKLIRLAQIKEPIADAIARVFKDLKLNKQSVIIYIPRHLATVRILELPSTDPREIADMVNLQVGKQTPYSKEEIMFAHRIVDTEREGYIKVMLVVVRLNLISERVEALEKNGIEIDKVALSSEGAYNWLKTTHSEELKLDDSQVLVMVDVDSNYSDFIVIRKEKLVFTRNIFIGANHLLKEEDGWQDKFSEELQRSIGRYQSEERNTKIVKIFLSGAARNIKNLGHILSVRLDIPVEIADPVKNIQIKDDIDILSDDKFKAVSISPLFGLAIGKKEIELDLTPAAVRIKKLMEEKRKNLTVMGILSAAIVMMASFLLLTNIHNKNMYLIQLKDRISQIEKEANAVRKMRLRINLIEKRLDAKGASMNILIEIYKLTPKEIYFTNINIEEKKQVILKGRAFAMSDVFKFVTTMENSPYFKNAKTTYTTTKKEKDVEYASFEIIGTYQDTN